MTYGLRSEKDGETQGWFHAQGTDLFIWTKGEEVTHLQVCSGADIVDWRPAGLLPTGEVRQGERHYAKDSILTDAGISAARITRLVAALRRIPLSTDVRNFAIDALEGRPPAVAMASVAEMVRVLKPSDG